MKVYVKLLMSYPFLAYKLYKPRISGEIFLYKDIAEPKPNTNTFTAVLYRYTKYSLSLFHQDSAVIA